MSYLEYAYPGKKIPHVTPPGEEHTPSIDEETGGNHYYTWRNIISREALANKTLFNVNNNPQRIPSVISPHYQDQNFIQTVQPLQLFKPATLAGGRKMVVVDEKKSKPYTDPVPGGLKGLVRAATEKSLRVKAVGTGHSFSDVMTTPDFLVVTDDLREMLVAAENEKAPTHLNIRHYPFLREEVKSNYTAFANEGNPDPPEPGTEEEEKAPGLVEFEAGIKIRDLNDKLWKRGWALYNMGTYQGQSFIGAASTSTHGSGHNFGPLPDMIRSMVIVGSYGLAYRIEPVNGITRTTSKATRASLEAHFGQLPQGFIDLLEREHIFNSEEPDVDFLVQDDDWFNSTLVNVGTFGIIYSVVIEVTPALCLLETVEFTTWKDLRKRLLSAAGQEELFSKKLFQPKGLVKKVKNEDNTFSKVPHEVEKIHQTTILFNPNKYMDENFVRITRHYYIDAGLANDNDWLDEEDEGRTLEFPKRLFAKTAIDQLGETVKYTKTAQDDLYEKNQKTICGMVVFQPVRRDHLLRLNALVTDFATLTQDVERTAKRAKEKPIQPKGNEFYINRHYRVYVKPSDLPGYGIETGFSLKPIEFSGDSTPAYIRAIDKAIEMAEQHWQVGRYIQTATTAVRFVKASRAYLSPQYGEDTCMIEMLNVADTHGGKELFYRYQDAFFRLGGRPHWGLDLSVTTGNNGLPGKMYAMFPEWKKVYDALNLDGRFNNRFTDRMGFSLQDFPPK